MRLPPPRTPSTIPSYPAGTLAYLDTAFHGLLPCKVVAVGPHDVTVRLTVTRGAYERGELVRTHPHSAIPRPHIRRRRGRFVIIGAWKWTKPDASTDTPTQPLRAAK